MLLRLVIFDLDGVLCGYDVGRRVEILARIAGREPEAVREALWGSGFEDGADSGVYPTAASYLEAFRERLGYPLTLAQWIAARREAMTPDAEVLDLARRVREETGIAVLTNNAVRNVALNRGRRS